MVTSVIEGYDRTTTSLAPRFWQSPTRSTLAGVSATSSRLTTRGATTYASGVPNACDNPKCPCGPDCDCGSDCSC